ncbi:hypothetical protein D3C86_955550 [compost metagenome]
MKINTIAVKKAWPVFLKAIITCTPAIKVNQGMIEAFSTGSHAQKPPKFSASYAQKEPMIIPVPNIITANNAHGIAGLTHSLYRFCHNPATA